MARADILAYGTAAERAAAGARLAGHLAAGGVLAYPTETVYGFGCVLHAAGLAALARLKGDRPFLLLVRGPGDAPGLRWTGAAVRLAERFWPGPLTLALDVQEGHYPSQVVGAGGAVAVRVSSHPAVGAILDAADGPVTSTSANRPGEPPALTAADAARAAADLAGTLVLDGGALPPAPPSTILHCGDEVRLIREGAITRDRIEAIVEVR